MSNAWTTAVSYVTCASKWPWQIIEFHYMLFYSIVYLLTFAFSSVVNIPAKKCQKKCSDGLTINYKYGFANWNVDRCSIRAWVVSQSLPGRVRRQAASRKSIYYTFLEIHYPPHLDRGISLSVCYGIRFILIISLEAKHRILLQNAALLSWLWYMARLKI